MNRTPRMLELIEQSPILCKAIAQDKTAFRDILYQIQMDSITEENRDMIAPTVLALKNIHDIFDAVILKGESVIEKENKKN